MKQWTRNKCFIRLINLYVLLYAASHYVVTFTETKIDEEIIAVTCNTNNSLFRNGSVTDDFDYCGNFNTALTCNWVIILTGVICYGSWVFVNILVFTDTFKSINTKLINQIKSENESLQTKLTEKTLKIANLQRQLANGRTDRRTARVENFLSLYDEQENERGRLLTINSLSDYKSF